MAVVRELRSLIYEKFDSESDFAKQLNWSRQKLNKITTGVKEPDLLEAKMIADGLGVSVDILAEIFLHRESPNRQHTEV